MQIRVYHAYYGCESGCCGHNIEIDGEDVGFEFGGPDSMEPEVVRAWARSIVEDYLPEGCAETIDWNEIDVNGVAY